MEDQTTNETSDETKGFLNFLLTDPKVRDLIKAPKNQSVVYCGKFTIPAYKVFDELKDRRLDMEGKKLLPEILKEIKLDDKHRPHKNLGDWIESLPDLKPREYNGDLAWEAVSKIMCANAEGDVSFLVSGDANLKKKVFTQVEILELARNSKLSPIAKELVECCLEAIDSGRTDFCIPFIAN